MLEGQGALAPVTITQWSLVASGHINGAQRQACVQMGVTLCELFGPSRPLFSHLFNTIISILMLHRHVRSSHMN